MWDTRPRSSGCGISKDGDETSAPGSARCRPPPARNPPRVSTLPARDPTRGGPQATTWDAGSEPVSSPPRRRPAGAQPPGRSGDLHVRHHTAGCGGRRWLLRGGAGWLLGGRAERRQPDLLRCILVAVKRRLSVSRGPAGFRPRPPACRPWSGRAEARAGHRVTLRRHQVHRGLDGAPVTRRPYGCPAPCPEGLWPLPLQVADGAFHEFPALLRVGPKRLRSDAGA